MVNVWMVAAIGWFVAFMAVMAERNPPPPCTLAAEAHRTEGVQRCLYELGPCTLWYDATANTSHLGCR